MAAHSSIVGGSSARRVIECPASVALARNAPPRPSSQYADRGTLLHGIVSQVLANGADPALFIGRKYNEQEFDEDLLHEKVIPALEALDRLDPEQELSFDVDVRVDFGDFIPGAFGEADVIGRIRDTAVVLDWKFGDGVPVDAEENAQLMFYAAAALRTPKAQYFFSGTKNVLLAIIQPPHLKVWNTTFERLQRFELDLQHALTLDHYAAGKHCKFCPAATVCPYLTGQIDDARHKALEGIDARELARRLDIALAAKDWIENVKGLAQLRLKEGYGVPGYKLVPTRASRQWADEDKAEEFLLEHNVSLVESVIRSPHQVEKDLKLLGVRLPSELVESVSSGETIAPESDAREAVDHSNTRLVKALRRTAQNA